jgi:hypothetical protein
MKQFYIIISTIGAVSARDFIYSGEFSHNRVEGKGEMWDKGRETIIVAGPSAHYFVR